MESQRQFFNSRAEQWEDKCYPPPVRERLEKLICDFQIRPGARVLDMGAGSGVLQPYLRPMIGPQGILLAFDISENMLRQARKKELSPLDMFFQGDALHLPLHPERFDHVICFAAFPHFPDPEQALREMARVAKRGGEVVIAHLLSREELARHHGTHETVADDVLPDAPGMRHLFQTAGLDVPEVVDQPGRYLARARKSYSR
ncbi:class I SAM-dependent methyltransferase [Desulfonatronum parangueonense]